MYPNYWRAHCRHIAMYVNDQKLFQPESMSVLPEGRQYLASTEEKSVKRVIIVKIHEVKQASNILK